MKHHGLHASLPIAINMVPNLMAQYGDRRIFFENHPCLVKKTTLETTCLCGFERFSLWCTRGFRFTGI